jgi:ABC-type sulfate transport system permease component
MIRCTSASPFQHLVKFTKISTLFAAALTILCAVMLFGWQITSWIQNGVWNAYPVSLVISSLQADRNGTYVTASVKKVETGSPIKEVSDWLLDIPAIVPLLIMSALLLVFYLKLSAIQKAARN